MPWLICFTDYSYFQQARSVEKSASEALASPGNVCHVLPMTPCSAVDYKYLVLFGSPWAFPFLILKYKQGWQDPKLKWGTGKVGCLCPPAQLAAVV